MTRRIEPQEVDAWSERILTYEGEEGYRTLIAELESDREFAHVLSVVVAGDARAPGARCLSREGLDGRSYTRVAQAVTRRVTRSDRQTRDSEHEMGEKVGGC